MGVFNGRALLAIRAAVRLVFVLALNLGCLSDFRERSFQLNPNDCIRLRSCGGDEASAPSTRKWLAGAHRQLAGLLPKSSPGPLLTEQMVGSGGHAVNVLDHFGIAPDGLQSLFENFEGLRYSAQSASGAYCIAKQAPAWPGFEDVWVPIRQELPGELSLSGRLGHARDRQGNITDADCLVILPGLFGDHGVKRSADLAIPLREAGFHVLDLELRGHGQTEARYPRMYPTFGVLETDDLMQVSDWLERQPHVRRTGLIAYCWNANIALLAAWSDGRSPNDPLVSAAQRPYMVASDPRRRRFSAGVIAFSPELRFEVLMDELETERSRWGHPIFAAIQDTVRDRMRLKGYAQVSGNLRQLVKYEYAGYGNPMQTGSWGAEGYMNLLAYKGRPAGRKLECARMPVLIAHGADDPLVPAQDIADLMATVHNPRVAALILPSGGHVGFAGFCPRYYLSLITGFFDPENGAANQPAKPHEVNFSNAFSG
jgi:predicted alpha/beta-fold hydrolase